MEFFSHKTQINFMQQKKLAFIFSIAIFIISLTTLYIKGLNLGLDFTGGSQIELHFDQSVQTSDIRKKLQPLALKEFTLQSYGTSQDVVLKIGFKITPEIKKKIQIALPKAHIERTEFIGPQVGKKLVTNSILAVVIAVMTTMIYITLRFEYRFAISAALSLIHDPVLILGVFAFSQLEFNLISLAALLTVLGYSLNDTIVVYDRVRENFKKSQNATPETIMNQSINQTLSRTIMTSSLSACAYEVVQS